MTCLFAPSLSEAQIQAIIKIQEKQRQQSGIGVAPTIHEIARGLVDTALATISAETATRLQE
ncbi:hypothetical protein QSI24_06705 [Klebsiella quasipneumoniae]|uniref:hypothetical protein n=1 Tax=Klebsiella quasipneumoniae TaxID=1463165 RepID=UPI00256EDAC0|nr:hypothetical protein [Klebsiella quasipneumoniae]MDL5478893.1 hypothetical protein [Klebsiella quasipneumoniae]